MDMSSYLIIELFETPPEEVSTFRGKVPLAVMWARNALEALAEFFGPSDVQPRSLRYIHGRQSGLDTVVHHEKRNRSFWVARMPDAPVPAFICAHESR